MSPSRSEAVPPEVLAIAVALAIEEQAAERADAPPAEADRWRWAGERWGRPAGHRWS